MSPDEAKALLDSMQDARERLGIQLDRVFGSNLPPPQFVMTLASAQGAVAVLLHAMGDRRHLGALRAIVAELATDLETVESYGSAHEPSGISA